MAQISRRTSSHTISRTPNHQLMSDLIAGNRLGGVAVWELSQLATLIPPHA